MGNRDAAGGGGASPEAEEVLWREHLVLKVAKWTTAVKLHSLGGREVQRSG